MAPKTGPGVWGGSGMDRRGFLKASALATGGMMLPGAAGASVRPDTGPGFRPNYIVFVTDDQAYDTVGCYGNPNVKTPNMDKLGANGVIFERHYDTTASNTRQRYPKSVPRGPRRPENRAAMGCKARRSRSAGHRQPVLNLLRTCCEE